MKTTLKINDQLLADGLRTDPPQVGEHLVSFDRDFRKSLARCPFMLLKPA